MRSYINTARYGDTLRSAPVGMSRTRELEVGVVADASSSLIQDPREAKEPMEQGCVAGEMGRDRGGV